MKFSELLKMDGAPRDVLEDKLVRRLKGTPLPVIQGVYLDHGRNPVFQEQYGALRIDNIRWRKVWVSGQLLANCSYYEGFRNHVTLLESSCEHIEGDCWRWLTNDPELAEHWRGRHTWKTPPFLLNGSLIGKGATYHLVEGHTRIGVLRGALRLRIIAANKRHAIWFGDYIDGASKA